MDSVNIADLGAKSWGLGLREMPLESYNLCELGLRWLQF